MAPWLCFKRPRSLFERIASLGGAFCHVDFVDTLRGPDATAAREYEAYCAYQGEVFSVYTVDDRRFGTDHYVWMDLCASTLQQTRMREFMESQLGVPYNSAVYAACPLHMASLKYPTDSWFCSEICATVMQMDLSILTPSGTFTQIPALVPADALAVASAIAPSATTPNRLFEVATRLGFQTVSNTTRSKLDAPAEWW
jgi:hypothetical protein